MDVFGLFSMFQHCFFKTLFLFVFAVFTVFGANKINIIIFTSLSVPDTPTDLRAVNVTDTKALLLWRPALAAVDKYAIVYGSGTGKGLCPVSCVSVSAVLIKHFSATQSTLNASVSAAVVEKVFRSFTYVKVLMPHC